VSGALDIRHLSVEIAGSPVLTDVILSIAPGAFVGLVGRNGAGKTTLMRAIMGLLPVRSGEMKFLDRDLRATPPHHRSGFDIGYMPEDRRLVPELTVEENVLMPAWANGDPAVAARLAFVYGILPEVKGMAPRRALQLSGGQQKLVALARALISRASRRPWRVGSLRRSPRSRRLGYRCCYRNPTTYIRAILSIASMSSSAAW
jgi:branched-chain amino acid transport system ATP-binding protein